MTPAEKLKEEKRLKKVKKEPKLRMKLDKLQLDHNM